MYAIEKGSYMTPDWMPLWGQQHKESGSRSDVLKPLIWPLGLTLVSIPALLTAKAPLWMIAAVGGAFSFILIVYVIAYIILLIFRPDWLRSEHFVLVQTAMQNGLLGDSVSGQLSKPAIPSVITYATEPSNAEAGKDDEK